MYDLLLNKLVGETLAPLFPRLGLCRHRAAAYRAMQSALHMRRAVMKLGCI